MYNIQIRYETLNELNYYTDYIMTCHEEQVDGIESSDGITVITYHNIYKIAIIPRNSLKNIVSIYGGWLYGTWCDSPDDIITILNQQLRFGTW